MEEQSTNWGKVLLLIIGMGVASYVLFYSFAMLRNEVSKELNLGKPYGFKKR